MVLTKDGEVYGASILKAFAEMSRAGEGLLNKAGSEIVRVSASPSFAALAALPHLVRFKTSNSALDVRLEARNSGVDFETESIDAAVQVCTPPCHGLIAHRLFRSKLAPLAHPDLCKKHGPVKSAKDLARLPLIELNNIPGLWERWVAKIDRKVKLNELSLVERQSACCHSNGRVRVWARCWRPFPLVAPVVASGRLSALLPPRVLLEAPDFHLLYRKEDANTPKIKAVRRWLKEIVAELEQRPNTSDL